jgi:hypothetical protein
LLQEILREDVNTAQVLQSRVLGIVSALLQRCEFGSLGIGSLMAVQALLERASPKAEFLRAVCKQLLFDFELWQRSSFSVRLGHVRVVSKLIHDHPAFFRQHYGVQYVLDLLRPSLKERFLSRQASTTQGLRHAPSTASLDAVIVEEQRSLQDAIFSLFSWYVRDGMNAAECRALCRFLLASEDMGKSLLMLEFVRDKLLEGLST